MPDWDDDSPQLRANLLRVLTSARDDALARVPLSPETARRWQRDLLHSLDLPDTRYRGAFRGEPGLEGVEVEIFGIRGVAAQDLARQLALFGRKLAQLTRELDALLPPGQAPDADQLAAVLDLCAWAHAEWIRLHPFANGNGRTARLWVNSLSMRYGLPPFLRLRPRPDSGYADAGTRAMAGDWQPTATCLRQLLVRFLDEASPVSRSRAAPPKRSGR